MGTESERSADGLDEWVIYTKADDGIAYLTCNGARIKATEIHWDSAGRTKIIIDAYRIRFESIKPE